MRFRFLDGLRGWAAVVVLLHHLFIDGLPANSFMADRALWAKVFFLNGTVAVSVFFVISGFSLSIRYLETGDGRALGRIAAGRYLRLALPIFAICAVTYVLLVSGLIPPAAQRPSPLDQFLGFTPSIDGLLGFSLLKVFVAYSGAESYDPPLWTMTYEFFGSFMVFALIAYLRPSRLRTLLLAVLFLLLDRSADIFRPVRRRHSDRGSVSAHRRLYRRQSRRSVALRRGDFVDRLAARLVRSVYLGGARLFDRGRCLLRAGAALLREPLVELPRLGIVPTLSGPGGGDLCVGAARARVFGFLRLRSRDAAMAARLRACPRRVPLCDRVLPGQRFCDGRITPFRRKYRRILR